MAVDWNVVVMEETCPLTVSGGDPQSTAYKINIRLCHCELLINEKCGVFHAILLIQLGVTSDHSLLAIHCRVTVSVPVLSSYPELHVYTAVFPKVVTGASTMEFCGIGGGPQSITEGTEM